jgi:hypothetical protein
LKRLLLLAALLALVAGLTTACFDPKQPGCAFSCAGDGLCPDNYSCGDDGFCHRNDGQGACLLAPATDGGADGDGGDAP